MLRPVLAVIVAAFFVVQPHAAEAATAAGTLSVTAVVHVGCSYSGEHGGAVMVCSAPVPYSIAQGTHPVGGAAPGTTIFF